MCFRDLLRRPPEAQRRYEVVKLSLAEIHVNDRWAYTDGKPKVVSELLAEFG